MRKFYSAQLLGSYAFKVFAIEFMVVGNCPSGVNYLSWKKFKIIMNNIIKSVIFSLLMSLSFYSSSVNAMTDCKLTYHLKGWSFVYKEYRGAGQVNCINGQFADVTIVSRSAGFTLGRSEIDHGEGLISAVNDINEVFGTYVLLEGHAGATKSIEGTLMTKGIVSLVLTGRGRGIDLGITLGAFSIARKLR